MPVNYVTTNANEYTFANEYIISDTTSWAHTNSDITNWTYIHNYELTPEDIDRIFGRINRVSPTNDIYLETTIAYPTVEPQEEEEFDTTEIEKYIDSLEKEVVGTEN